MEEKTHKFLVMHEDGLLVGVDVELDDIAVSITEQQLITWTEREKTEKIRQSRKCPHVPSEVLQIESVGLKQ